MSLGSFGNVARLFSLFSGLVAFPLSAEAAPPLPTEVLMVSPKVAEHHMLTHPAKDARYRITLPPWLNRVGTTVWADLGICVSKEGQVTNAQVRRSFDLAMNPSLLEKAMTWKYEPYKVNGHPVPYCYLLRYEHTVR